MEEVGEGVEGLTLTTTVFEEDEGRVDEECDADAGGELGPGEEEEERDIGVGASSLALDDALALDAALCAGERRGLCRRVRWVCTGFE